MSFARETKKMVKPIELNKSELGFVTSVHLPTRTFYIQLCKNTMEELIEHNEAIDKYCTRIERGELKPSPDEHKIRSGDYVCAKYLDGKWYRSLVLNRDKATGSCSLQMIDYGNFQVVELDKLILVDADQVPGCFWRQPFGITCSIVASFKVVQDEATKALNCLHNKYLLVNILGQRTKLHYEVDIPKLCYNMPFWDDYDPSVAEILRKDSHRGGGRAIETRDSDEFSASAEESLDEASSTGMVVVPGL